MIRKYRFQLHVLVILAVALALRLIGIDWDKGIHLHPDERYVIWVTSELRWPTSIGQYFNTATSPLNPYNTSHDTFIYGTFPPFVMKAFAGLVGMDSYDQLRFVGRTVSSIANVGSILFAVLLARRFFDTRVALLTGWLLAFTPLMIQLSRFSTVDAVAAFLTVVAFYGVVRSWDKSSIGWLAFAGVMVGLAGASKPNYLLTVFFLGLPLLELVRTRGWRAVLPNWRSNEYPAILATVTSGLIAFWTFRIAMPYAFRGPHIWDVGLNPDWTRDLNYWRSAQVGLIDMKSMVQWADRTPILYIVENMTWWGFGAALGLAVLAGLGYAIWRILRSSAWPNWFYVGMVGWCVANIIQYGLEISQAQRYLIQVYPFLGILAAAVLFEIRDRARPRWIGRLLLVAVTVYTVIYGLSFDSLYVRPITRLDASAWIYENIPAGSVLSNEYWDDSLPMPLDGYPTGTYQQITLDLYGDESQDASKATVLVGQLSQLDYVVLSSNRLIGSIAQQPDRYPIAMRFYEMLLSGELGFEPVADFTQGPEIFGIEWDDSSAEESLTVYEHPQVRIFRKTDAYDAQKVYTALSAAWGDGGYQYIPGDPLPEQMLMSAAAVDAADANGSWHDQVGDGFVQRHPLAFGWLTLQVIGLATWPLVRRMAGKLPVAGWVLAKAAGMILLAAITLALVAWGSFAFNRTTVVVSLLLLALISLAAARGHWTGFRRELRHTWRHIAAAELLMLSAFLVVTWVRLRTVLTPDADLLQFTSLMRSSDLPPLDLWLSGGLLHTHWAPLLPWASVGRLLALSPQAGLNLAVIGTITLVFGLIYSMLRARTGSWLAAIAAILIAFGAGSGFVAGLAPQWSSANGNLAALAVLVPLALMIVLLMSPWRSNLLALAVLAVSAGLVIASEEWGAVLAAAIVISGLALRRWHDRSARDPWWPTVRRGVLEIAGILIVAMVIWYPAITAFKATARNTVVPSAWSLDDLQSALGPMVIVVGVVLVVGIARVAAETMNEGTPGIVAAGVGIGAIVVLIAAAIALDVAIMLILLATFLVIIAACSWYDHPVMSWSLLWTLLALLMLIYLQTRKFHPDPVGNLTSALAIPSVWLLLGAGATLGGIYLITRLPRYRYLVQIGAALLVGLLMLTPSVGHWRDVTSELPRQNLSSPAVQATADEIAAAQWLQQNTTGMPILISVPDAESAISVLAGTPTVLGNTTIESRMRPGWESMVDRRRQNIDTFYSGIGNWDQAGPILDRYDVSYVVVGPAEIARYGPELANGVAAQVAAGNLEIAWQQGEVTLYRVIRPSVQAVGGIEETVVAHDEKAGL